MQNLRFASTHFLLCLLALLNHNFSKPVNGYSETSEEFKIRLEDPVVQKFEKTSADFQFAASVVSFGMLLRDSEFAGTTNMDWIISTAQSNLGSDHDGFRGDFVTLAKKTRLLLKGHSSGMTNVSLRD